MLNKILVRNIETEYKYLDETGWHTGDKILGPTAYSGSMFVTKINPDGIYSSPDGINWTYRTATLNLNKKLIWTGTYFFNGTTEYSADGITWAFTGLSWSDVDYGLDYGDGNGHFFFRIGENIYTYKGSGNQLSEDNYFVSTFPQYERFMSAVWDGQKFLVGLYDPQIGPQFVSSTNGQTWSYFGTQAPLYSLGDGYGGLFGLSYSGTRYVAVGEVGPGTSDPAIYPTVVYSDDGLVWTDVNSETLYMYSESNPYTSKVGAIFWDGEKFTINGSLTDQIDGRKNYIATSPDGRNWTLDATYTDTNDGRGIYINGPSGSNEPPSNLMLCWQLTAQKTDSMIFQLNGDGPFPKSIDIPDTVILNTIVLVDEGVEIDKSKYQINVI